LAGIAPEKSLVSGLVVTRKYVSSSGNPMVATWRTRLQNMASAVLGLLLPATCAVCRQIGDLLCSECRLMLPRIQTALCSRCGRVLPNKTPYCSRCARHPLLLQQVLAPFFYKEPLSGIIHQLKYTGLFALAEPLGDLMAEAWPEAANHIDVIVPIPLHEQRQKMRGYNQAALLAHCLGQQWQLPVDETGLRRGRYTQPQVGLSLAERQRNVAGAFVIETDIFAGKRVLLVDDVYTTGSTLSAAAKTLLEARVTSVWGYCAARSLRQPDRLDVSSSPIID
jgi:ComF family protein